MLFIIINFWHLHITFEFPLCVKVGFVPTQVMTWTIGSYKNIPLRNFVACWRVTTRAHLQTQDLKPCVNFHANQMLYWMNVDGQCYRGWYYHHRAICIEGKLGVRGFP
jgi:uncharacterized protein involved in response to NO